MCSRHWAQTYTRGSGRLLWFRGMQQHQGTARRWVVIGSRHAWAIRCSVLCCVELFCTSLYCAVLYCVTLCCVVLYCAVFSWPGCAVIYCAFLCCLVLCHFSVVWSAALCCTITGLREGKAHVRHQTALSVCNLRTNSSFCRKRRVIIPQP